MGLFYEVVPLVGFFLNLVLAFFVLRQNPRRRLNQVFSIYLISMSLWAFVIFGMRHSPTLDQALPWEKAIFAVLPLVSVSYYHFVSIFIKHRNRSWHIPLAYATIIIAWILVPSHLLVNGMKEMWYGHGFIQGTLMFPYMFIFYGIIILALIQLIGAYTKLESKTEKRRYAFLAAGVVICVVGLFTDSLAARGVQVYPMGMFSNIIFSGLTTYAILKYQLLDIPVIIRKGTTYVLVSAFGIGTYVGLLVIGYIFISGVWSLPLWLNLVFILVFAIFLQPLLRWAQNTVDRWFYRGRYDYLNALERLAEETRTITDLDFIADSLVSTITFAMRCLKVDVLLPDNEDRYFASVIGPDRKTASHVRFSKDSALIWLLRKRMGFLTRQDITILPQLRALTVQERTMLDKLDGELFIPLKTREGLRGILVLGKKLSDQEYSNEEIKLLHVVANQMATVVENARLYDLQTRRYLEQSLLARLSMTIASELDFGRVYDSIMKEIQDIISVDYSVIMITGTQERRLPLILEYNSKLLLPQKAVTGLFLPENLKDVEESKYEPDIVAETSSSTREPLIQAGLRSLLCLPLHSKSDIIGYLVLASKAVDAYNEDYIKLLRQIAVQMAIAYEKSHLYELERKTRLELEQQERDRTEFINSLIHEIKTPITAMLASCDLLSEELPATHGVLGELADNLSTSIDNLNRRVSELTDFAKLQNTQVKVNLQAVDMHSLVEKADSLVSGLLHSRNQVLNCELGASSHQVNADPDRVIQILLNLLTNASKFSKPFKEIGLITYSTEGFLVTEVVDSAAPILAEDQELLFRPYNLALKKESGGLGLGLFICKKLVELHGGKIWLEAAASGNRFKFSLPLVDQKEVGKIEGPVD